MPSLHDIHQDHTTMAKEGLRAFKNTTILGYELIWNNLTFNTQCFIKLNKEHIDAKIRALKEYLSQGKRDYLYYRVWIDYSNDVNPNVWGSVQVQLWLSPEGRILNTYVIDCRGKQSDYMNGKMPRKTSGEQFFFIERY